MLLRHMAIHSIIQEDKRQMNESYNLIAVYEEASNWVRTGNILVWSMAGIFIPLALGGVFGAFTFPHHEFLFASGSISLYAFWVWMTEIYTSMTKSARRALVEIEKHWALNDDLSFFTQQGQPFRKFWGLRTLQYTLFVILGLTWILILKGVF